VRLTEKGRNISRIVADLFARHAEGLRDKGVLGEDGITHITSSLKRMERYWSNQIRYIY
jgi:ribosome biogenesis protein Tsr3